MPAVALVEPLKVMFLQDDPVSVDVASFGSRRPYSSPGAEERFQGICLPGRAGAPALSDHKISSTGERHRVPVARRRKIDGAASHVVLVVVLTTGEAVAAKVEIRTIGGRLGCRGGEGPSKRRDGNDKFGKGEHFGCDIRLVVVWDVSWQESGDVKCMFSSWSWPTFILTRVTQPRSCNVWIKRGH